MGLILKTLNMSYTKLKQFWMGRLKVACRKQYTKHASEDASGASTLELTVFNESYSVRIFRRNSSGYSKLQWQFLSLKLDIP